MIRSRFTTASTLVVAAAALLAGVVGCTSGPSAHVSASSFRVQLKSSCHSGISIGIYGPPEAHLQMTWSPDIEAVPLDQIVRGQTLFVDLGSNGVGSAGWSTQVSGTVKLIDLSSDNLEIPIPDAGATTVC